jgi:hypothetical protein
LVFIPMLNTLGIQRSNRKKISRSTENDPNHCRSSVVLVEEDMSVFCDVVTQGVIVFVSILSVVVPAVLYSSQFASLPSFVQLSVLPLYECLSFVRSF